MNLFGHPILSIAIDNIRIGFLYVSGCDGNDLLFLLACSMDVMVMLYCPHVSLLLQTLLVLSSPNMLNDSGFVIIIKGLTKRNWNNILINKF